MRSTYTLYEMLDRMGDNIVQCSSSLPWYVPMKTIERVPDRTDRWKITFVFASGAYPVYAVVDKQTILKLIRKYRPMSFTFIKEYK